jgi:hypothetical protein
MLASSPMSKIVGTVKRNDLAGGHWTLETEDGECYQLAGQVAGLRDGMRASVEGKVAKDVMGIGMTGPTFTVDKLTELK